MIHLLIKRNFNPLVLESSFSFKNLKKSNPYRFNLTSRPIGPTQIVRFAYKRGQGVWSTKPRIQGQKIPNQQPQNFNQPQPGKSTLAPAPAPAAPNSTISGSTSSSSYSLPFFPITPQSGIQTSACNNIKPVVNSQIKPPKNTATTCSYPIKNSNSNSTPTPTSTSTFMAGVRSNSPIKPSASSNISSAFQSSTVASKINPNNLQVDINAIAVYKISQNHPNPSYRGKFFMCCPLINSSSKFGKLFTRSKGFRAKNGTWEENELTNPTTTVTNYAHPQYASSPFLLDTKYLVLYNKPLEQKSYDYAKKDIEFFGDKFNNYLNFSYLGVSLASIGIISSDFFKIFGNPNKF